MNDVTFYTNDTGVWIGDEDTAELVATLVNGGVGGARQTRQGWIVYTCGRYMTKDEVATWAKIDSRIHI